MIHLIEKHNLDIILNLCNEKAKLKIKIKILVCLINKLILNKKFNCQEIIKDLILNRVRSLSPPVGAATIHCGHCQYTVGNSIMRGG